MRLRKPPPGQIRLSRGLTGGATSPVCLRTSALCSGPPCPVLDLPSRWPETHRFARVDVRQVSFELLHRPVLETVDGLVAVLLVGRPDDQGHGIVHDTLIHGSEPSVSAATVRLGGSKGLLAPLDGFRWRTRPCKCCHQVTSNIKTRRQPNHNYRTHFEENLVC